MSISLHNDMITIDPTGSEACGETASGGEHRGPRSQCLRLPTEAGGEELQPG